MKNSIIYTLLFSLVLTITSCDLIEGIFKVGIWVGAIGVLLIIGLIFWIVIKMRK